MLAFAPGKFCVSGTVVYEQAACQGPVLVVGEGVEAVRPLPVHHARVDERAAGRAVLEELAQVVAHDVLSPPLVRLGSAALDGYRGQRTRLGGTVYVASCAVAAAAMAASEAKRYAFFLIVCGFCLFTVANVSILSQLAKGSALVCAGEPAARGRLAARNSPY